MDVGQGMTMKVGECIVRMSNECYENQFVGVVILDLEDEREVLSDDDIVDMQQMCPIIRELKQCCCMDAV